MRKREMANSAPAKPPKTVTVDMSRKPDAQLRAVAGAESDVLNNAMLNRVMRTAWIPDQWSVEQKAQAQAAAVLALAAFKAKDAVEGMLAAQAVGLHNASMECMRRAMIPDQPFEAATKLRKDAASLSRAMTDMLDALDRKRGKGPQVVRVERVVVQEGAQAIVGNVTGHARPGLEGDRS
ncbi:hypothetical protein [Muricoccus vinaceus]|uniref:Uncharacterized protein n=1 Tax=Muricoccus vinaceus TaxID=424704 RepID=A0ABV6J0R9_9PROT